ncbi:glycoside hydrolase family 6 protein [Nocardioides sp. URHA0032]|uniref:glycoside hydrolase family 6 protein n=1 Tax=Nocardioides sp. URHA0032 TaxID=1380388 RepID=UPI000491EBCE|nr:glycoside hydrolase family 6 protein [Nocardioides sp. URHA0032]
MKSRALAAAVAVLVALGLAVALSPAAESAGPSLGAPVDVQTTVVGGQKAIRVTWGAPTAGIPAGLAYEVLLDGDTVGTALVKTSFVIDDPSLVVGHTYEVGVRSTLLVNHSSTTSTYQQLYVAPVTTVQAANPTNPLAGREWGVYRGLQDPAVIGWNQLGQAQQDKLAPIAMIHKAKFFGRWITDGQAEQKTREYIEDTQAGDPQRLTILTLFRMFPWEGEASILKRLPTAAEQAAYKKFVNGMAEAIGSNRVAVVLQPDGFFAWKAFQVLAPKLGRKAALLPARMLSWTSKTLSEAGPNVSVYVDMGSEDWALGKVAPVAKFLKLSGVKYARGFSLDVSHKNYLDREILFAQRVSQALAKMGLPNKHAVIDTSDNGQPFAGKEINPPGGDGPYTPPGEIDPCTKKNQGNPCTALGVPPTTDVANDAWGLKPGVARAAAQYVDAYLWVSRPWLPDQGAGGTKFSPDFATKLLNTWTFSPYFS